MMMRAFTEHLELARSAAGTLVELRRPVRVPTVLGTDTVRTGAPDGPAALLLDVDAEAGRITGSGPVDLGSAEQLGHAVSTLSRGGELPVTVDLTGVTHLSSAGVRLLHELRTTHAALRLVAAPGSPARAVLTLTGLPVEAVAAATGPTAGAAVGA